jgi:NADH dehydrogenase
MILVAGGTGTLGSRLVSLLAERGEQVRVLTRDRARAARLDARAEVAVGDTGDPEALRRAAAGARTVVSAIHGFAGTRGATPASVDRDGNRNLIGAALAAGAEHMILVSVRDASPGHPMAFGRGANPINWVTAWDVARFAALAAADPALRGRMIEVGGPENLTMTEFVRAFQREAGAAGRIGHIPRPLMRLGSIVARPINPAMARQIQAGLIMDTQPQAFDASAARRHYPPMPVTSLTVVVRQNVGVPADVLRATTDQ